MPRKYTPPAAKAVHRMRLALGVNNITREACANRVFDAAVDACQVLASRIERSGHTNLLSPLGRVRAVAKRVIWFVYDGSTVEEYDDMEDAILADLRALETLLRNKDA